MVQTDQPILAAEAYITYDATQLALGEVNYKASPLNSETPDYQKGGGYIKLSLYKMGQPYPTGTFELAKLSFQVLQDNGTSTISITQDKSQLVSEASPSTNALTSVSGVSIALQPTGTEPAPTGTFTPEEPLSETSDDTGVAAADEGESSNNLLWVAIAGLVLVAAGVLWYFKYRKPSSPSA